MEGSAHEAGQDGRIGLISFQPFKFYTRLQICRFHPTTVFEINQQYLVIQIVKFFLNIEMQKRKC